MLETGYLKPEVIVWTELNPEIYCLCPAAISLPTCFDIF